MIACTDTTTLHEHMIHAMLSRVFTAEEEFIMELQLIEDIRQDQLDRQLDAQMAAEKAQVQAAVDALYVVEL